MVTLYVTQPGATVRLQDESLAVTGESREAKTTPDTARHKVVLIVQPHRLELVALMVAYILHRPPCRSVWIVGST